jgi:hypothetical protein
VLTGVAGTDGAKLAGTGKIIAGGAEITGAWQAVGSTNVTLSYTGISSAATGVFTATAGTAAITVPAGVALTIPATTTIALANDLATPTAKGTITLQAGGGRAEGGKIIFAAATSVIKSGLETTDGTAITVPSGDFVLAEGAASGKITVSSSANVKVNPGSTTGTKLNSIKVTASDEYIQAYGGEGADGVIGLNTAI